MTDFDLLPACAAAVERRAAAGWPQAARATQALDVARADYRPLDIPAAWPERFGLDDVDLSLLEIAVAVDQDPLLHLLLGLLSGDPGPGRPTPWNWPASHRPIRRRTAGWGRWPPCSVTGCSRCRAPTV